MGERKEKNVRPKEKTDRIRKYSLQEEQMQQHSYVNHTLAFLSLLAWRKSIF